MVVDVERNDSARAVVEVEHEGSVEGAEAAEVGRIETSGRVGEADLADAAGRVGPPLVHGAVGERDVGGKVAEEVEGECRRPEQVGPEALVVEALVRLGIRRSRSRRRKRTGGEEVRAGLLRVRERETAADWAGRGSL